jgi:hypothetical protein
MNFTMNTENKKKRLVLPLTLSLLFAICFFNSNAQVVMPKDEAGKITYLEVLSMDSIPRDTVYKRIMTWIKFAYPQSKLTKDSSNSAMAVRGRFLVYLNPGVIKEIHGAIRYDLSIELKENRYRYTFTNFVFEYYKQDRNYKYVPTGNTKPLEDEKFPGWQSGWIKHKNTTDAHIKDKIADLKKAIENKKPETMVIPAVKKNSKDW